MLENKTKTFLGIPWTNCTQLPQSSSSQTPATPDVEETAFVRRTSPRKQKKRKPDESTPLSTAGPSSDKRARLFKVSSR